MKTSTRLRTVFCILALTPPSSARALDQMSSQPAQSQPAPTSSQEVLLQNPIKLSITQTAPASDLPQYSGSFTMDRSVQVGLEHNLEYGQSEIDTRLARFNVRAALAKFGPNLSVNTFYSTSSLNQMLFYPGGSVLVQAPMQPIVRGTLFSVILAGIQPLYTGGFLRGNYRAAKAQEKQSIAKYQQSRIDSARIIKQLYLKATWNEARLRVDSDYVKLRTLSASNMKQRMEDGKVPRADYLREESDLAQAQAQVNQDYRDYNVALVDLKAGMGINLSSLIDIAEPLEARAIKGDLNSFLNAAGSHRPEIAQARSRVDEMQAKRMVSRSGYLPHLDLYGLGSNITGTSPDGTGGGRFGGFVSVIGHYTIYDAGQRGAELHAATESIRQSRLALQQAQLKVAQDVSNAWIDVDLSSRNIELAKAQVVSAEEDNRLIRARYEIGKSTALDQFDAAVKLYRARLALTQAIYNYRLAQTQLNWASGSI